MCLSIKYIPIYTKNIDEEVKFFTQYFNLINSGRIKITPAVEGVLLKLDTNKELYLLILPDGFAADIKKAGFKIIINTNDCLKEYLLLKSTGIEFEEKPQHLPVGLAANFKLADGSQYMLLEERNYNQLFT